MGVGTRAGLESGASVYGGQDCHGHATGPHRAGRRVHGAGWRVLDTCRAGGADADADDSGQRDDGFVAAAHVIRAMCGRERQDGSR
jgi:hypothetical protein